MAFPLDIRACILLEIVCGLFVVYRKNMSETFSTQPCSEKQRLVLTDNETDVLCVGGGAGSGKSYMSLIKALKYVQDPAARVVIVRLTYPMLKSPGGLVDESKQIYHNFGAIWKTQPLEWHFPNGAQIKFVAMPQNLEDVKGWQATNIIVDEGAEFSLQQILAMNVRLRGARYKGKIGMTITCNPSRSSWLYPWVEYCLDRTTGVPVPGTEKITRWFVILNNQVLWGSSPEELHREHGQGTVLGETFIPQSFRFIPMTIYDNPVLIKQNPQYLAKLLGGTRVSILRFLKGSWTAVVEGTSFFQREWVKIIPAPSQGGDRFRSWDLAATLKSESNTDPDYTAGVLMSRSRQGHYCVEDVVRGRMQAFEVMQLIEKTAKSDGLEIPVTIPRDPGAGGKTANMFQVSQLSEAGIIVHSVPTSTHSSKVNRFLPFAAMCEAGLVSIVEGDWNEQYLLELETFVGSRKDHDDQVDATSDAFNRLCRQTTIPSFVLHDLSTTSIVPTLS